jgi:hypothetical protein
LVPIDERIWVTWSWSDMGQATSVGTWPPRWVSW